MRPTKVYPDSQKAFKSMANLVVILKNGRIQNDRPDRAEAIMGGKEPQSE